MKLATNQKASQSFNLPSYSGSALFRTCLEHPLGHHNLYPETETFEWPEIHFYESSRLIGILLKTWEHSGSLYKLSEGLVDDLDYIHPSPSLLFYRFMYKYKAKPPPNNYLLTSLHHSQTVKNGYFY
jgi:hypothetical protein